MDRQSFGDQLSVGLMVFSPICCTIV